MYSPSGPVWMSQASLPKALFKQTAALPSRGSGFIHSFHLKKKKKISIFFPSLELMTHVTILHSLAAPECWDTPIQFSRQERQGPGLRDFCHKAPGAAPFQSLSRGSVTTISITNTSPQKRTETHYCSSRRSLRKA